MQPQQPGLYGQPQQYGQGMSMAPQYGVQQAMYPGMAMQGGSGIYPQQGMGPGQGMMMQPAAPPKPRKLLSVSVSPSVRPHGHDIPNVIL